MTASISLGGLLGRPHKSGFRPQFPARRKVPRNYSGLTVTLRL